MTNQSIHKKRWQSNQNDRWEQRNIADSTNKQTTKQADGRRGGRKRKTPLLALLLVLNTISPAKTSSSSNFSSPGSVWNCTSWGIASTLPCLPLILMHWLFCQRAQVCRLSWISWSAFLIHHLMGLNQLVALWAHAFKLIGGFLVLMCCHWMIFWPFCYCNCCWYLFPYAVEN